MSQLIIEPYLIPGEEDAPAILPRLPVPGTPGAPSNSLFRVKEWVHMYAGDSTSCTILRGKMSIDGQEFIPCILKVDLFDQHPRSLLAEASIYENQAKSLQGNVVPRFYGLFQGQVSPGYLPSTCIVLEDCGDHMRNPFADSDDDFISKLLKKFMLFHDAGLQHNAISERNVTVKNGEPFIIDLKLSRPHKCDRIPIKHGAIAPDEYEHGCWELYEFIYFVMFYGSQLPKGIVTTPEELVELIWDKSITRDPVRRKQILEEAQEVVKLIAPRE